MTPSWHRRPPRGLLALHDTVALSANGLELREHKEVEEKVFLRRMPLAAL
jgi:hypothetical protein